MASFVVIQLMWKCTLICLYIHANGNEYNRFAVAVIDIRTGTSVYRGFLLRVKCLKL